MAADAADVQAVVTVVDNGPLVDRFGLVVLAEGFRLEELDRFREAVVELVELLRETEPFAEHWESLSLVSVETVSERSGLGEPGSEGQSIFAASAGAWPRTMSLNWSAVESVADAHAPDWRSALVLVNDSAVRGCAYQRVAATTLQDSWLLVALHELGHQPFDLEDEYDYDGPDRYTGLVPSAANVTVVPERASLKWGHLVQAATSIPTLTNDDCSKSNARPSPVPAGTIGTFEGAAACRCGIHRSEYDCIMRSLVAPRFCRCCAEHIARELAALAPSPVYP